MGSDKKKAPDPAEYNRATYGERIRRYRLAKGLSQPALAQILGVKRNYISNWEQGVARPDMNIVPKLCDTLDISIERFFGRAGFERELTKDQRRLLHIYRGLGPVNRELLDDMAEKLYELERRELRTRCRRDFSLIFHGEHFAAAGTDNFLEDGDRGTREYIRSTPLTMRADEIITVSGNSMEPTFSDGDDLLIEYTKQLREGEIGILLINGEGFVKEYHHDGVYSHNEAEYPFRRFEEGDDVRCFGRVLGKVTPDLRPDRQEKEMLSELLLEK